RDFLSYIVKEDLAGRGETIRGKIIAQDVYGRDPVAGGDPENVVRVEARRMRQTLDHYYDTAGASDPVRIFVDTGGYRPRYERREAPKPGPRRGKPQAVGLLAFVAGSLVGIALMSVLPQQQEALLPLPDDPPASDGRRTLERQAILDKSPASLQAVNLAEQAKSMLFPLFDAPRQTLVSEVFRRVIELDPDYFGGYAGASQAFASLSIISPPGASKNELSAAADEMSRTAIRLEPTQPWAQSARSWSEFANGNFEEALRLGRRAEALSPEDVGILDFLGAVELFTGHFAKAISAAERVSEKGGNDQRSANRNIAAAANFHLGKYDASLAAFQAAAEFGNPLSAPSLAFQAADLNALGRETEALQKIKVLTTAWPDADIDAMLRGIYQHPEHAEEVLNHLRNLGWTPGSGFD
ncbi:MAG: hypothetical protein GY798_26480, partial [Hyphomicrobiales bacterium]|nr:hypothetical protein [Hyphomicrobiales bacterium]